MNSPKISVIIPVYNVEKYLQTCIDSLLSQSMKEIEFIFVNDASPDGSLSILQENQRLHPDQIRIIDSKVNLKQGGARNLGIAAAQAPLIGFLDSDDFAAPDMYQDLYARMLETDADVVFTQYANVPEDSTLDSVKHMQLVPQAWSKQVFQLDNVPLTDENMQDFIPATISTVWSGLWKKSLFVDNNIFFPEQLRYEDNYFCSLLRPYTKKIAVVPGIHVYYRQVASSTVHTKNTQFQFDRITIEKMLLDEVKKRGFFEKYYASWEYIYITRYAYNTIVLFLRAFDQIPVDHIRSIKKDLNQTFPNWRKNVYLAADRRQALKTKFVLCVPLPIMMPAKKLGSKMLAVAKKLLHH